MIRNSSDMVRGDFNRDVDKIVAEEGRSKALRRGGLSVRAVLRHVLAPLLAAIGIAVLIGAVAYMVVMR